jgi:hypothetical protein
MSGMGELIRLFRVRRLIVSVGQFGHGLARNIDVN